MQHAFVFYCVLLSAVGCGGEMARESARKASTDTSVELASTAGRSVHGTVDGPHESLAADLQRKIIYEAEVSLVVTDFSSAETEMPRLVKEHGGYLADVSIDRTVGERRSGRWQARIPVDRFEPFLAAVSSLGVPESRGQTAEDVTEEYIDLGTRIANKKRLEERILKLLQDSEGKIKDVIEVERELARVRGEIEQMEGRLRYLTNRIDLTTVTITAREQRDYVPPEAPTLAGRIQQAWETSLASLRRFGEGVMVAIVFAFPWLVALVVVWGPAVWYARRRKAVRASTVASEQPRSSVSPRERDA